MKTFTYTSLICALFATSLSPLYAAKTGYENKMLQSQVTALNSQKTTNDTELKTLKTELASALTNTQTFLDALDKQYTDANEQVLRLNDYTDYAIALHANVIAFYDLVLLDGHSATSYLDNAGVSIDKNLQDTYNSYLSDASVGREHLLANLEIKVNDFKNAIGQLDTSGKKPVKLLDETTVNTHLANIKAAMHALVSSDLNFLEQIVAIAVAHGLTLDLTAGGTITGDNLNQVAHQFDGQDRSDLGSLPAVPTPVIP